MEGGGTVTTVDGGAIIQRCMTGPYTNACRRLACKPVVCCLNKAANGVVLVRKKEETNDKGFLPAEAGSRAKPSKSSSHRQQAGYGDMGEIKAQSAANLCESGGIQTKRALGNKNKGG